MLWNAMQVECDRGGQLIYDRQKQPVGEKKSQQESSNFLVRDIVFSDARLSEDFVSGRVWRG
jgi:hypothetical protein